MGKNLPVNTVEWDGRVSRGRAASADVQVAGGPAPHVLLTVIVPAYNEARTVEELLRRVLRVPLDKQLIVVDDASSDGSGEILERWRDVGRIELVRHERNRGKGAAIRSGLERARGRFTIVQDADLEYDPEDYAHLLEPLERGEARVVYGSRYLAAEKKGSGLGCSICASQGQLV